MPKMYFYAEIRDGWQVANTLSSSVPLAAEMFPPGMDWEEVGDGVSVGDALLNGEHHPKPRYAVHGSFDVSDLSWQYDLDAAKSEKIVEIDAKTSGLIAAKGFEFSGKRFSMSEAAQRNWLGLSSALANGMLKFPTAVSTIDEQGFVIQSDVELKAFLAAYMLYQVDPSQPLGSGRTLKALVAAAATIEELEAIVDDRE